jgi:hypothetical protein
MAGQHFEEDHAKGEDVAAGIGAAPLQLFRRHVVHGAGDGRLG